MKTYSLWMLLLILTAGTAVAAYTPSNKIFTYQGRLMDDNTPAEGPYDIVFRLLDGPDPDTASAVSFEEFYYEHPVSNGYFTVELNFAPFGELTEDDIFDGSRRWLWIGIRSGELKDPNEYTYLEPLTKLTPTPYAHLAHRLQTPAVLRNETTEPILTIANEGDGPELLIEGNGTLRYSNDAFTDVLNDYIVDISNSQTWAVGFDSTENIGHNRSTAVSGTDHKTVGINSTTNAGGNIAMQAGQNISMVADNVVQLQNKVSVSNDPNDLLKANGAISLQPMDSTPPLTTGYGKLFVNNTDDKLYFLDSSGKLYDLTALKSDRVSFSVKRDISYAWPTSSSFENVDFAADTTILDNTGLGFNHKSGAFIAPADGLYTFHGAICFTSLGKGDEISAAILAAGTRYRADMTSAAGGEETVRASITLYLNENDQVTLQGHVSAAAPPAYAFGNPGSTEVFTYFTGARVD